MTTPARFASRPPRALRGALRSGRALAAACLGLPALAT